MASFSRVEFPLDGVPFPVGPDWDSIRHVLVEDGLPCPFRGSVFRPVISPFWVAVEGRPILIFGRVHMFQAFGIDYRTRMVVEVLDAPSYPISLVNTSVQLFVEVVSFLAERYPFCVDASDGDACEAVANELRRGLESIDAPCVNDNTFWGEFYWDVVQGDWAGDDSNLWQVDWMSYQERPPSWWPYPRSFFKPTFDDIRLTNKRALDMLG